MNDALNWKPAGTPKAEPLEGRFIRLEKLDPARHGNDLWEVLQGPGSDPLLWDYLPYGPFAERAGFDLHTLRVAVTGAADIPVALIREMRAELPFRSILTGYGLTEAGTCTGSRPDDDAGQRHAARVTRELAGLERRGSAAGDRGVEQEDGEHARHRERDHQACRVPPAGHARSVERPARVNPWFPPSAVSRLPSR